jgi:hypothetical protein
LLTADVPKPHSVLQQSGTTTPSHVLCRATIQPPQQREAQLKFFIGLRLLGEKKKERFLAYMLTLQETKDENGKPSSQKEGKNDS